MKSRCGFLVALAGWWCAGNAPGAVLHLSPGQDYRARYAMTCFYPVPLPQFGAISGMLVELGPDVLMPGERLSAEVYDEMGGLVYSTTFTNAYQRTNATWFLVAYAPHALPHQGNARLIMDVGELDVESIVVRSVGNDFYHQCEGMIAPEARPVLVASPSPAALMFQWPTSAVDFVLESALDLSPPARWEPVKGEMVISNEMYSTRVEYEAGSRLFRLKRP